MLIERPFTYLRYRKPILRFHNGQILAWEETYTPEPVELTSGCRFARGQATPRVFAAPSKVLAR